MNGEAKTKKKELLDRIIQVSEQNFLVQRPNVAVSLSIESNLCACGFAKVSYPDTWNEEFGKHLAARKAAACILKQAKEKAIDLSYLLAEEEKPFVRKKLVRDYIRI